MFLSLEMQAPRTSARPEAGFAEVDPKWEAALAEALTPALSSGRPAEAFVAHLGRQLAETARCEAQEQKILEQRLRAASIVGGVVSLVGGLVFWLFWRQRHKPQTAAPAAKPGWTWGWKPLSRAHPTH
jgi:hypothetical protein